MAIPDSPAELAIVLITALLRNLLWDLSNRAFDKLRRRWHEGGEEHDEELNVGVYFG